MSWDGAGTVWDSAGMVRDCDGMVLGCAGMCRDGAGMVLRYAGMVWDGLILFQEFGPQAQPLPNAETKTTAVKFPLHFSHLTVHVV